MLNVDKTKGISHKWKIRMPKIKKASCDALLKEKVK